ncbi:TNT domain-containing protein [Kitasatospora sp. NPDC087315]|uniref:TNT domain-containing protein n=1 Tax=Kitasatospora sp. NPDC087315 TaxID=3364069 RepID=UPI00380F6227
MRRNALAACSLAAALLVTGAAATESAAATAVVDPAPQDCPREADRPTPDDLKKYYCGFKELGPATLPAGQPVAALLKDYRRFGGLTPDDFLKWYREGLNWKYPANNGFRDDGDKFDETVVSLPMGKLLDRFGENSGGFLADAGTSFAQRSLTPQSLDYEVDQKPTSGYHCFSVLNPFSVQEGHIAAAYAQPGNGVQQWLDPALTPKELKDAGEKFSPENLIKHHYLQEEKPETCAATG